MLLKKPMRLAIAPALVLSGGLLLPLPTLADEVLLEEVVVTAQKRQEKLSDVPIAVSVLSKQQIDAAFSNNLESLQALVPSVSFRKGNTTRNSAITVRGIGTISFSIAAEPSVSTVVDGVVLGRSGQAFADLYDLERIEVLRGPQGTLFGKNASAGVVNMTTKRPGDQFEASVEAVKFEGNEHQLKARVSGALSDNVRASLTALDSSFDGYIKNTANNDTVNGYDRQGLRGMLEYDASDDTSLLFIAEYYDADDECCADLEGLTSGRDINPAAQANSSGNADIDLDQRRIDHDFETRTLDKTKAISMQINHGIGDYEVTAITAYRNWDNTEFREGDFTSRNGDVALPVNFSDVGFQLHDVGEQEWRQLSQEIRLASPQGETNEWQIGAFYWNIESERSFIREASCQNTDDNTAIVNANPGSSCLANDIVSATAFMDTEFNNWAVFGEGKYNLSDSLRILYGLRYTDDEVSFKHRRVNNDPLGRRGVGVRQATLNTNFSGKTSTTNTSGKLGLQWDLGESSMAYATWSQGYKGPGFNVFYNMAEKDTAPIDEEKSDAFEIGYKYSSGSLRANVAIFRTEIEGFQANNFDTSGGTTITRLTNAGDVSTQGIEVDFQWQASEFFSLSGGIASIDAEIDKFLCPAAESCTDRSGLDVPFSPDLKYSLNANYVIPLDNMDIILNGTFVHTDEQQSTLPGNSGDFDPAALLPEYDIFNASVALSFNDDQYRLTLIGKNLGDESFATTYSGDGFRYQIPREAERYYGVSFKANF